MAGEEQVVQVLLIVGAWFFGLLWSFFVVAKRARDLNVKWLTSKASDRLWSHVAAKTTANVAFEIARLNAEAEGIRTEVQTWRQESDASRTELLRAMATDLQTLRQEIFQAMGAVGGITKKMNMGARQLAEQSAEEIGREGQSQMTPQQAMMLEVANLPEDPSKGHLYNVGVRIAKQLAAQALVAGATTAPQGFSGLSQ